MNFLQFFIWGAWLLTIGAYWFQNKQWSGTAFGAIFSTMGIASLFMPALMGVVADKWINAEKLYGVLHIGGRSEEHTSELQSLMRISYAVFCLKQKNQENTL